MTDERMKQTIAMLLTAWPSSSDDSVDVGATIRVYQVALDGVRQEYVDQAVKAFMQGRVPDHDREFRPKPARLAEYARSLQAIDDRTREIAMRVAEQRAQIEYKKPPQAVRDRQVEKWKRFGGMNIDELASLYVAHKISVPGTTFDYNGAHFPDGTHHSIEQMRKMVSQTPAIRQ